jgi:hypothetical protein
LKQFYEHVVRRWAHDVAPGAKLADAASKWSSHIKQPAVECGKIIRSEAEVMNGSLPVIAERLVVQVQAPFTDAQKRITRSTKIPIIEDFGSESSHVPFDRRFEVVCKQMRVVKMNHNHQPQKRRSCTVSIEIRNLVFQHHAFDLIGFDAISDASVRLDRHALDNGVGLRLLDLNPPSRALTAVKNLIV